MDLEKLKADWAQDPALRHLAFDTVEELAEHLVHCHGTLMGSNGGPFGYLYKQQLRRVRELQEELKNERKQQAGRREPLRGRR